MKRCKCNLFLNFNHSAHRCAPHRCPYRDSRLSHLHPLAHCHLPPESVRPARTSSARATRPRLKPSHITDSCRRWVCTGQAGPPASSWQGTACGSSSNSWHSGNRNGSVPAALWAACTNDTRMTRKLQPQLQLQFASQPRPAATPLWLPCHLRSACVVARAAETLARSPSPANAQ